MCLGKPKKCLKQRFAAILKEQSSGKAADYIPECDKKGKFAKLQCKKNKCKYITLKCFIFSKILPGKIMFIALHKIWIGEYMSIT